MSDYVIEVFDELPPAPPKTSKLVELLEQVKEQPIGKPVLIKRFDSAQKATGTANHLKLRWGNKPDAYGFKFITRRIDDQNHGLFVVYDPSKIVEGESELVDKAYDEHRRKAAEKVAERKMAEKAGERPKRNRNRTETPSE